MDAITVLDDVVNQLTDSFRRADSVNYLYRACRKIVEAKIAETEGFDFGRMLTWLEEMKARCHKGKYKCIKRIVYGLNDYLNQREFSSTNRFVYPNDNSQFRKTSKASQQIISDYVSKSRRCSLDFQSYLKSCIGYYFLFLERNNLDYKNISYDDIFSFRAYIRSLKLSCRTTKNILNINAEFIYDTGADLKTRVCSLILRTTHANYIEKISTIQHDVIGSFDLTDKVVIDYDRIPLFFEELRRKKYTVKSQIHAKRIAYELLFFSFRYNIPLTFGNTFLWAKFVCENIVYDLEYRSFGIKFVEFLQKGTLAYLNSFSDSPKSQPHIRKHQIDYIPSWSKLMVDKYIAYRRNLGYRANTINMDCNSIYRFITNISDLGIDDYPSIRSEHVLSFGAPNAETGIPGDFYFDIENLVRYQKKASGWSVLVDFNDSLTRKYNVEFKTNGGQFASSTFTGSTTIERGHCFYADGRQVPLVVRQGFIFDGWYTTKNPDPTIHGRFTDLTNVYSDRTLYANWIQDTASN